MRSHRRASPVLFLLLPLLGFPVQAQRCDIATLPGWPVLDRGEFATSVTVADVHPNPGAEAILVTPQTLHLVDARGATLFKTEGAFERYRPAFADLDGDGLEEFVLGDTAPGIALYDWNLANDTLEATHLPFLGSSISFQPPVLVDLDGDGTLEILAFQNFSGTLYAIDLEGNILPGWPVAVLAPATGVVTGPLAVGDLDDDGSPEIAFLAMEVFGNPTQPHLFVLRADGSLAWEVPTPLVYGAFREGDAEDWRRDFHDTVMGDVDGNGTLEVAILLDADLRTTPAFHWQIYHGDGTLHAEGSFPAEDASVDPVRLALADLDGDRAAELIAIGHDQPPRVFPRRGRILAWHGDGSPLAGFPTPFSDIPLGAPRVADVNGDRRPDIVPSPDSAAPQVFLAAWRGDGRPLPCWPVGLRRIFTRGGLSPLVLGDLGGNREIDLLTPLGTGEVHGLRLGVPWVPGAAHWAMDRQNLQRTGTLPPLSRAAPLATPRVVGLPAPP